MSKLKKLLEPFIYTIQSFQKIWIEQKFSKRFDNVMGLYFKGHNIYAVPAKITPNLQFILPQGIERVFTTDSCNEHDLNDRTYEFHDPTTGNIIPCYLLYDGSPVTVDLKSPVITKSKNYLEKEKIKEIDYLLEKNELDFAEKLIDEKEYDKIKDKLHRAKKIPVTPAQSIKNYYVNAEISNIAYKFFVYIILRFMNEQNKRELLLILLAWGAVCLFVGSMITLFVM